MSDLGDVWRLTRSRLDAAIDGISSEQLRWRPHAGAHNIGEMLYHIASSEQYWWARLTSATATGDADELARLVPGFDVRLDRAVKDGFLREAPCPYGDDEITPEKLRSALDRTSRLIGPIFDAPAAEQLARLVESPIGDPIDGREGLLRVAQHAAYHTGQIWMIRMSPGFPA